MSQCFVGIDTSHSNGIHIYSNVFYLSQQRGNLLALIGSKINPNKLHYLTFMFSLR